MHIKCTSSNALQTVNRTSTGARPVAPVSYTDYEVDYPILTSITDDDKNGLYICHGVLASLESFGPAYGLSFSVCPQHLAWCCTVITSQRIKHPHTQVFEELLNVTAQRFPTSRAAALVAGNSNYSVLAPTDDAWDASNVEMDMLFSNATMMKQRVDAHIVRLPTLQTSMDKLGAHIAAVIKQPVLLHTQKVLRGCCCCCCCCTC